VGVDVSGCREVPLPHTRADLSPAHPLMVEQADPAVAEVVRTEHGYQSCETARPVPSSTLTGCLRTS
jgi:hypothetical protein